MRKNLKLAVVFSFLFLFCSLGTVAQAAVSAKAAVNEAAKKDTVAESISYLTQVLEKMPNGSERRSLYYFLGATQEQLGLFDDARISYAAAASIAAGDAPGMEKRSNEQLVLDAVRCALSCGDFTTADAYLNSAVRNSANETLQSYIKLYSVWSLLCRADDRAELEEPLALLNAYSSLSNMEPVRAQVLFTLWYLTGEQKWATALRTRYANSFETGIINGAVRLLPAPFWYFVPHNEILTEESDAKPDVVSIPGNVSQNSAEKSSASNSAASGIKLQLGLFRDKANADALVKRVGAKGFNAYITTEKRSSGTTYYIVLVNETNGSVADRLRSAGFECYRYD